LAFLYLGLLDSAALRDFLTFIEDSQQQNTTNEFQIY